MKEKQILKAIENCFEVRKQWCEDSMGVDNTYGWPVCTVELNNGHKFKVIDNVEPNPRIVDGILELHHYEENAASIFRSYIDVWQVAAVYVEWIEDNEAATE